MVQSARTLPDRLLHSHRHRAIRRRLSQARCPETILVVCHGNICRSPYLQAVLQRALPRIRITSGGFVGRGRPVPLVALAVSSQQDIDLSRFRSQPVTRENAVRADWVIVMDLDQARHLARAFRVPMSRIVVAGDLDPATARTRGIRDPFREATQVYEESFRRLDRCAATLVEIIERSGDTTSRVETPGRSGSRERSTS